MPDSTIDFIGIGAPRCGTTWLAECLRQHPDVLLPIRTNGSVGEIGPHDLLDAKELCFFTTLSSDSTYRGLKNNRHKGMDWYLHRFPPARPGKKRGEISAIYLQDPASPQLIKTAFPKAKLIVSLRNPADMIYSAYWFEKYGLVVESFETLLDHSRYLAMGLYAQQLMRYLELFPREQIHIIIFEDIAAKPEQVVRDLYAFLDIDSSFQPSVLQKKINSAKGVRSEMVKSFVMKARTIARRYANSFVEKYISKNDRAFKAYIKLNIGKRSYAPIRPETRAQLAAYYRQDIELLEKLIGRDLSAWKNP